MSRHFKKAFGLSFGIWNKEEYNWERILNQWCRMRTRCFKGADTNEKIRIG